MLLTSPYYLIGLLAVGLPIAIHLLQMRRYRKVYFSNVDMLDEIQSESRRQRNLRKLLILACRILAVVFLVLAFCRPVIPDNEGRLQAGATVVSVYVDNSFSMENSGTGGSLLEVSRKKAKEIAEAYGSDVRFQLLTNEALGTQFRWLSREEFLASVEGVQICAVTESVSSMALRMNEFLRSAPAANRHAYVVSDFQRSTADILNYPDDSLIFASFVPIGSGRVSNIYIDSLGFNSPVYFRGATAQVEVEVANGGDRPVEGVPLRLFVNGRQRALATVDIAANGSAKASMAFTVEDSGTLRGYVETEDYPVVFDDRLYFSLEVMDKMSMLVVRGAEENPSIRRLFHGDSLIACRQEPLSQIDYARLSDNRFVVLDEVRSISTGLAQSLHDFVSEGGTLLVVPGSEVDTASYNRFLASMRMPVLGGWSSESVVAEWVQQEASLYKGVFLGNNAEMELPTVLGHYRFRYPSGAVGQSLIRLLDGSDFLMVSPFGEGRCYMVASPLRKEYTDFVLQALFVPTLYNMALFSTPIQHPYHLLSGGRPIPLSGNYENDNVLHLCDATREVDLIPDIRQVGSKKCLIPHGEIKVPGTYYIVDDGVVSEGLTFNYSRQESDLSFYDGADVARLVEEAGLGHCAVVSSVQKSLGDYVQEKSLGKPLWRWCLVLALLALLAEVILIRIPQKR